MLEPERTDGYLETYFEVVQWLTLMGKHENSLAWQIMERQGTGGLYDLARELTNKFETVNSGRAWDGEFFDEVEAFLKREERFSQTPGYGDTVACEMIGLLGTIGQEPEYDETALG